MTQQTQWRAFVTLPGEDATTAEVDRLARSLPGFGIVTSHGERLVAELTVEAATVRQASEAALRAAREAYAGARSWPVASVQPTGLRVVTVADYDLEMAHPDRLELVGLAEAGDILGVSHQRVAQLAEEHPDFPAPVADLKQGRVFTAASIEAFQRSWQRRPGRPRKASGPA